MTDELTQADKIWNRANDAYAGCGPDAGEGDRALAALLLMHNLLMNGGTNHVADGGMEEPEIQAAYEGYRYFGLDGVVDVIERARLAVATAADSEDIDEDAEAARWTALDDEYYALVPDDQSLTARFEAKLATSPEAFAPLAE